MYQWHYPEFSQKLECRLRHTAMFYPKDDPSYFDLIPICLNQGYCVDFGRIVGDYTDPSCYCKIGYYGEHCEFKTEKTSRKNRDEIGHVKTAVLNNVIEMKDEIEDEIVETKEF